MNNTPKTEILEYNVNWNSIKRAAMRTIGKDAGDKEPPELWKKKILICRHSPIRKGWLTWKWSEIPYSISTHFSRHHNGCEKFIQTERTDRTGIDRNKRSQMDSVSMEMDANLEALINISGRRLCTCADPITRDYTEDLRQQIEKYDSVISWAMVPQCVRAGGCCEPFSQCKYYENFARNLTKEEQMDLITRLDKYNEYRDKVLSLTKKKQD